MLSVYIVYRNERLSNAHGKGEQVKIPLLLNKVGKRSGTMTMVTTIGLFSKCAIFISSWYADLILRIKELESWTSDFSLPPSVWLSGFFNPQSFLTAIMQVTLIVSASRHLR